MSEEARLKKAILDTLDEVQRCPDTRWWLSLWDRFTEGADYPLELEAWVHFNPLKDKVEWLEARLNQTQAERSEAPNPSDSGPAVSVMGSGKVEVDEAEIKIILGWYRYVDWNGGPVETDDQDRLYDRLRAVLEQEGGEGQ